MREEQPAQSAGSNLSRQVSVIELISDALPEFQSRGFEAFALTARSGLRNFFDSGPAEQRVISSRCRTRRIQHTRSEERDRMLDNTSVKTISGAVSLFGFRRPVSVEAQRQS